VNDSPRRRRSEEDHGGGGGGGLPLFPLILVVIFAGLLLGGVLARFFGNGSSTSKATPPPVTYTTAPEGSTAPLAMVTHSPLPLVKPSAKPSPAASESPSPSPTPKESATPKELPTPKAKPTPEPTSTPRVVLVTPAPHKPTPGANDVFTPSPEKTATVASATTPAPNYVSAGPDQATSIVRSYIGALARGDRATATTYLAHGLPSETFIDSNARIISVHPESSSSPYKVSADVQTTSGEYFITFTLQQGAGGLQITDHYAIKPQ